MFYKIFTFIVLGLVGLAVIYCIGEHFWRSHKNKQRIRLYRRPLDKDDDVFTLDEFIKMVKNGSLIDYDGSGYYSDGKYKYSTESVEPSDVLAGNIDRNYSHVVWFNR